MNNTILIVDDNLKNCQLAASVLHPYYRLLLTESGEKAIEIAKARLPDLILLDVMMPGLSGFETCKILKENPFTKDIPIIFVTAKTEETDIEAGFNVGAVDYISKPFRTKEILSRVKTHISLRSAVKELEQKNEELKNVVANRDRFFSIIAHDLRSPFHGLKGIIELLTSNPGAYAPDEMNKFIQLLNKSVNSLFELLENLLEWAKIQRNDFTCEPSNFDINDLIKYCVSEVAAKADIKSLSIIYNPAMGFSTYSDHHFFTGLMRNLLSNALKFTHRGKSIRIGIEQINTGFYEITVADEGTGIPEDKILNLFHNTNKYISSGTEGEPSSGLGLVLCREYAEKQGGRIWVESKLGEGSTFHFTIPLRINEF